MKASEFKVGQTAYKASGAKVVVTKVGRKYVYTTSSYNRFKETEDDTLFLIEDKDWGAKSILFNSESAYKDYMERVDLKQCQYDIRDMTLSIEQLRVIKRIVEDGANCCKDCALYDSHDNGYGKCGRTPGSGEVMKDNDFCSRAVSKEVNKK